MGKIFAFLTDKLLVLAIYKEFLGFSEMGKNISKGHQQATPSHIQNK